MARPVDWILIHICKTRALGLPLSTLGLIVVHGITALGLGEADIRVVHQVPNAIADSSSHGDTNKHHNGKGAAISGPEVD